VTCTLKLSLFPVLKGVSSVIYPFTGHTVVIAGHGKVLLKREHLPDNMPIHMSNLDGNKYILFLTWFLKEAKFISTPMHI
jgi:hypothetical protein